MPGHQTSWRLSNRLLISVGEIGLDPLQANNDLSAADALDPSCADLDSPLPGVGIRSTAQQPWDVERGHLVLDQFAATGSKPPRQGPSP